MSFERGERVRVRDPQDDDKMVAAISSLWPTLGPIRSSRGCAIWKRAHEMLPADFAGVARELEEACRLIWPGHSEERWRAFRQREAAPPGRASKRQPLLSVVGR